MVLGDPLTETNGNASESSKHVESTILPQPEHLSVGQLLSEVEPEQVEWLWPGRLPLGKLAVLDGDPGLGKSVVTLDLAARVSASLHPQKRRQIFRRGMSVRESATYFS